MSRVFPSWRFLWDRRARRELTTFQRGFLAMQGFFLVVSVALVLWAVSLDCDPGDGVCTAESEGRGMWLVLFLGVWILLTSAILIGRAVGEVSRAIGSRRAAGNKPAHPRRLR